MRDIRFRAWDMEDKRMVLWDEIADDWGTCIFFNESWLIPMQFTGLHDKNGKEIWEGDILSFVPIDSKKFNHPYRPFIVEWREKGARFTEWSPRDTVEVIGNIYEHPGLLQGDTP